MFVMTREDPRLVDTIISPIFFMLYCSCSGICDYIVRFNYAFDVLDL
jgi:hypothetical protein